MSSHWIMRILRQCEIEREYKEEEESQASVPLRVQCDRQDEIFLHHIYHIISSPPLSSASDE